MKSINSREPLVLSLIFNTRGFGYALFEGVLAPVDWGIKTIKDRQDYFEQVRLLLHLFNPSVIVLQDCAGKLARCSKATRELIDRIAKLAGEKHIKVRRYSRTDIRTCFAFYGARNKDEIARAIAKQLPEFTPRVPPMRKLWMSEDYRMGLFDALSLMFTYYAKEHLRPAQRGESA
jgi:hypothetical protein